MNDRELLEMAARAAEPTCRRCGGALHRGQAIEQTFTGSPDFPGGEAVTMSPGGPGRLVECNKCDRCGHSFTGKPVAEAAWAKVPAELDAKGIRYEGREPDDAETGMPVAEYAKKMASGYFGEGAQKVCRLLDAYQIELCTAEPAKKEPADHFADANKMVAEAAAGVSEEKVSISVIRTGLLAYYKSQAAHQYGSETTETSAHMAVYEAMQYIAIAARGK